MKRLLILVGALGALVGTTVPAMVVLFDLVPQN